MRNRGDDPLGLSRHTVRDWHDAPTIPGDQRWTRWRRFTRTPASATTITMASTVGLTAGLPIRYMRLSGGTTYYYGRIKTVNSGNIVIDGPSLSGQTITKLWIGNPELVVQVQIDVPGLYALATGGIMLQIAKVYFEWQFGPAFLVNFKCHNITVGDGTAKVNMTVSAGSADSVGVFPGTAGGPVSSASIQTQYYGVVNGTQVVATVTATDTGASDLSVLCTFVLA